MGDRAGVLIAGAGHAGFQLGASLRELGYHERIVIVGAEPHLPYLRPPLSKTYLTETSGSSTPAFRNESFYAQKQLEVLTGKRVEDLQRDRHRAVLDCGATLAYEHFIFAVGARNRRLQIPGADLGGVHYLRTLGEADAVKAALRTARSVIVIGAGFIGLEVGATAAALGACVTVIEVADRPMARALSPAMSAIMQLEHANRGLRLLFGMQVTHLHGEAGRVIAVETGADGESPGRYIEADLVLVGIGVVPNTELAAASGLEVNQGIVVDGTLATRDSFVSAVGDCALHPNPFGAGPSVRIESVQNATDQARCVAARLTGNCAPYERVPWFWSDQGALKLQIAGLAMGVDRTVTRGDCAAASCAVYCFRSEQLVAVETLNRPAEHLLARRLIAQRSTLTWTQAADENFDLKTLLSRRQS